MAALNRLTQRIKENFIESTRDIQLLTGGAGSSTPYFDTSDDKIKEISKLLESRSERDRLEAMKRIIAGLSKGRDMEGFFAQVVKNVVAGSIEIRKLVYIFLLRYAATNSDLLLLSINTFQKDLSDSSPLIRSMSLRVLTSIRVPVIQGIVMLGLKKLVNDRNPWVRKTVAGGLAKLYDMDSSALPQLITLIQTLLASPSPLTLGATLTAFMEICPDRLDLLHPYYHHIVRLLVDSDEWGQIVALQVLTLYARTMLEKPDTTGNTDPNSIAKPKAKAAGDESEIEFEGIDTDLAMFLHLAKPLFQSRNPAVILGMANAYYHLAPANGIVGQQLLVAPLLHLAGASHVSARGEEIAALTWDVIVSMVLERKWLFTSHQSRFFVHDSDSTAVKTAKMKAMAALVSSENAAASIREFKHYVRFTDDAVAEEAVRSIGSCIRNQPDVAAAGLSTLMKLLRSSRDTLVAQTVIVLKSVILSRTQGSSLPEPQNLVARLAKQLDGITNPRARASVFWLVGQFAASDVPPKHGLGWDGVASWVPDVLRKGVKGFVQEPNIAKLQILTLATKLLVLSPTTPLLLQLSQYLFALARYDQDYDIRDRARFLGALQRGIKDEKPAAAGDEDEDVGGVVLRREQVKVVLLAQRGHAEDNPATSTVDYDVGSMSRMISRKLNGYTGIPEWTDDPTDPSLRESELDDPKRQAVPVSAISSVQPVSATPRPVHLSAAGKPSGVSPVGSSPAGSLPTQGKAKFQDLDAFLNSDTEESSEESESDEEEQPRATITNGPLQSAVPVYEEESSEEETESEEAGSDEELVRWGKD